MEAELLAAGVPVEVRVKARPANRVRHGRRDWVGDVMGWEPDVVVLHFGQADNVHLFLPRWAERHANSSRARPHPLRVRYRRRVVRPVWITLAKAQQRLERRVGSWSVGRRQRGQVAELLDLISLVRATSGALVLVPELLPPGPPWADWFAASTARMAEFNRLAAAGIAELADPRVEVVPLTSLVRSAIGPTEEPTPDGGHYTAAVHRVVGAVLADAVLDAAGCPSNGPGGRD
jgi:hypothetical protein